MGVDRPGGRGPRGKEGKSERKKAEEGARRSRGKPRAGIVATPDTAPLTLPTRLAPAQSIEKFRQISIAGQ